MIALVAAALAAHTITAVQAGTKTHEGREAFFVQREKSELRVHRDPSSLRDEPYPMMMQTNGPIPRTIEKGDQSNVEEARQVLVRTDAEWARLWQQHSPDRPRPAVDFAREMVVGIFMGSRPNAGFSTAVSSTTAGNGALIVRYTETLPKPGAITAQILTFPYHLVAIPRADVKDLKFEKVQ
jgi:protease stability complex PrcB-like protein